MNRKKQALIESLHADLALRQGQISLSLERFESAARRLGIRVPRSTAGALLGAVVEALKLGWHSVIPVGEHTSLPIAEWIWLHRSFHRQN